MESFWELTGVENNGVTRIEKYTSHDARFTLQLGFWPTDEGYWGTIGDAASGRCADVGWEGAFFSTSQEVKLLAERQCDLFTMTVDDMLRTPDDVETYEDIPPNPPADLAAQRRRALKGEH